MAFLPEVLAQERKGKEIKMVVHFRKGLSFARVRKWNPGTKKQECENKGQEQDAIKAFNAGGKTSRFHGSIVKCTNQSFAKSAGKLSISRITTMESLSQA